MGDDDQKEGRREGDDEVLLYQRSNVALLTPPFTMVPFTCSAGTRTFYLTSYTWGVENKALTSNKMVGGKVGLRRRRGGWWVLSTLPMLYFLFQQDLLASAVEIKWTPGDGDPPEPYSKKYRDAKVGCYPSLITARL